MNTKPKTPYHARWLSALALFLPAPFVVGQSTDPTAVLDDEEVVTLSPFTVDASEEEGYRATSTLAGTRIKTDVKDVGASVSIYTQEFLEDINGQKLDDVLTFTANTEVGGVNGNFQGFSGENDTSVRVETARSNRVRGLASATLTRGYFATDIPWDGYNSNSLTVVRGPNAVLAGAGAPGGVINGDLNRAVFRDSLNASLQVDNYGSHRKVVNINKEIIKDRWAMRIDLLGDKRRFRQEPAFDRDERLHIAMDAVLREGDANGFLGRTTLRGNFETGTREGTPPSGLPPLISFDGWFNETPLGKWYLEGHRRQRITGVNATAPFTPGQPFSFGEANVFENWSEGFPMFAQVGLVFADASSSTATVGLTGSLSSIQGYQGVGNPGGGFLRGTGDQNRNRAGFFRTRLLNTEVFDFTKELLTGAFDFRSQEFEATNVSLEQLFFGGKAGLEFAYNTQQYDLFRDIPIPANSEVFIDLSRTLSVEDENELPILNPNFSRPMIRTSDAFRDATSDRSRESIRLTAFLEHDFRDNTDSWIGSVLGRHTLTGLFESTENQFIDSGFSSSWPAMIGDYNTRPSVGNPGTFRASVNAIWYLGPPTFDLNNRDEVRFSRITTTARPDFGESYDLRVYTGSSRTHRTITGKPGRVVSNFSQDEETFDSLSFGYQAHLFDEHLIALYSLREDTSNRSFGQYPGDRDPNTGELITENLVVVDDPELTVDSLTTSLVGVFPEKYLFDLPFESDLRVFWNDSENFSPAGSRRNIYNEDVGPPRGQTEEYGIMLSMFNGKLDLRTTWYETKVVDSNVSAGANPYGYIGTMMNRMIDSHNQGLDVNDPVFNWHTFGFNSFIDVAQAFRDAIPDRTRIGPEFQFNPSWSDNGDGTFIWNPDGIPNYRAISDTVSKGVEFEAVFNPTANWRIALSVAQQEALRAGIAAQELEWADALMAKLDSTYGAEFRNGTRNPSVGEQGPWFGQYNNSNLSDIRSAAASSGTLLPELAEWRVNLVTNYQFRQGFLKGVSIGGNVRWTDERAVGYPQIPDGTGNTIADINNPYFGPDQTIVGANVRYNRKLDLFGKSVNWTTSLFVANLLKDDDLIITGINPDGTIGQVRVPPEQRITLTTAFRW